MKYKILAAAAIIAILLVIFKLFLYAIPVMGAGLTAFIILAVKAYLGRKVGRKLEEKEQELKDELI